MSIYTPKTLSIATVLACPEIPQNWFNLSNTVHSRRKVRVHCLKRLLVWKYWHRSTKRYGYQNVQEFYRTYHKSYSAYITYNEQVTEWEETYGEKTASKAETFDERLQRYQREAKKQYIDKNYHNKDKGRDNSPLFWISI